MRQRTIRPALTAAAALLLAACAGSDPRQGLAKVEVLTGRIDVVRQDAELTKQHVDVTTKALQEIAEVDFANDATAAYTNFVSNVEESSHQLEALRASVALMKEEAIEFFKHWEENLPQIADTTMRQRSQERLAHTRERFDKIVTSSETVLVGCDAFHHVLQDYVAFLKFDFNSSSVAMIRDDVRSLTARANDLDVQFLACEDAAREYIDAAALPGKDAPAPKDG
jgi:hypothetical protein